MFSRDVGVIGGGGHVGLPLALTFAECGLRTVIYDVNHATVESIREGRMPFEEEGAQELLDKLIKTELLEVHDTPDILGECRFLVMIIGTPLDEHLNPRFTVIHSAIDSLAEHMRDGQILILRSTVYPGITQNVQDYLGSKGLDISVTFCPERVAQGYSLREIKELPQIVSGFNHKAVAEASKLFSTFNREIIELKPIEAELAKLMTNAWRYAQFAIVNQLYMIASERGINFSAILHACRHNYPRMAGTPGPGFAAGPCLVKDTMQLAAFAPNGFILGHAAMMVNEGLPMHLVQMAKKDHDLSHLTAGILGMAFKGESDDPRDSLSYKLKKILILEAKKVLCTDPYVKDPSLCPLDQVLRESDILFVGTPHNIYRQMRLPSGKILVDVWDCIRKTLS